MKFGLTELELEFLKINLIDPLKSHGAKVYIFGSRAVSKHQKFSDIDVLYEDIKGSISADFIYKLRSQMEDSNFPYKIDLVNRAELAQSYLPNVEAQKIEV